MAFISGLLESSSIIELIRKLKENDVPEEEHSTYVAHFFENKARNQGIPLSGSFELTPLCNLDCKMCYVHLSGTQFSHGQLLPTDVWIDIIQQAYKAGMRNAILTGGECLTYPGFNEVYLYLYSLGIMPGILSNGILMDKKRVEFFKRYPPKMIQITVYGSSEDAYETVTGHRVFQIVYHNLLLLRDAGIPVKMSITPNSYMRDDVESLLELLQGMGIPYNINANLIPPRKNTGRKTYDLSVDEYVDIFTQRSKMNHRKLAAVDLTELPDENHHESNRYGFICGAGRSSFGIRYDGNMCPCLSMDEITANVLQQGFQNSWKEINVAANRYPLPKECGECVYFDRCLPCVAMHKNTPRLGHCDPRICERTKKLVGAGFIPVPGKN